MFVDILTEKQGLQKTRKIMQAAGT